MKSMFLSLFLLTTLALASDPEALVVDLEKSLMAPCCWSGTVYDHGHPEMEEKIRQFVYAGKSRQEIIDYFVSIYGERILAVPVAKGFNLLAWITPAVIALIGIGIIVVFVRTPKENRAAAAPPKAAIPFDDEIEKELEEFDS
ncbi:MAG: cytochrome c-type biogenesis protein CcmH [Candidatus Neomarinimicrobiota bacterium]|nr:MAG: cytochrome c-type biogenesis protein CcmH [Candidatus Neomarinimicrobiota bacterium]